jgi:galactokinase
MWTRVIPMRIIHDRQRMSRERLQQWYKNDESNSIASDEPTDWPSYILGILEHLLMNKDVSSSPIGFNIVIICDIPCDRDMASSAALEVSMARAGYPTCLFQCSIL